MKTTYIHEQKKWPAMHWNQEALAARLASVRHHQGRLLGRMEEQGFQLKSEAALQSLTEETLKSSEIEGDILERAQVRSSIARRMGIDKGATRPSDRHVEGVVSMMMDATQKFKEPLTAARLFTWHSSLFPGGRSGLTKIRAGAWRDDKNGPMQVVSGIAGRETLHYQAPAAKLLPKEISAFLTWFNSAEMAAMDGVLAAALAHFWFVTIHPFDDGNGRIARAIADLALSRCENSPQRFYSMSAQIRIEREDYYQILETTQKGGLDISAWMEWFLACLGRAFEGAETMLASVLKKSRFRETHRGSNLNVRQIKMLNRLLDGFHGKLTSSKWASLCKCSQDSASRDIDELLRLKIMAKDPAGGRSTSYSLIS